MTDEEMPARPQVLDQASHHLTLGVGVEVDHHVAQEDHVEQAQIRQRAVQVDLLETDALAQRGRDPLILWPGDDSGRM